MPDIAETDLSEATQMLDADFGLRMLCGWMRHKFGIETTPDEFRDVEDRRVVAKSLMQRAEEAYNEKEAEYPVLAGISRFTAKQGAQVALDREGLIEWVQRRFGVELSLDEIRLNRDELKIQLVQYSRKTGDAAEQKYQAAAEKLQSLFGSTDPDTTAALASGGNGALNTLTNWLEGELDYHAPKEDISRMNRQELALAIDGAVDDRFHPEMRRMERQILLSIVDEAWKNHLLTMDHLRSSVALKGYAQLDPKVEYKREGMRLFESMWESIGERVTDLIFRMESFNEEFIRSTWVEGETRHDDPTSASGCNCKPKQRRSRLSNPASKVTCARADSQPRPARRPQRSLPLWEWKEIQTVSHAEANLTIHVQPSPIGKDSDVRKLSVPRRPHRDLATDLVSNDSIRTLSTRHR